MKKSILYVGFAFLFFSGIMRHDVDESKYVELANQPQFDCAGSMYNRTDSIGGSCVLISKKHVLSAAHCFFISDIKKETIIQNGRKTTMYIPVNTRVCKPENYLFTFKNKTYQAKQIIIHPNYVDSIGNYDIAVIELETEISDIKPVKLNKIKDELKSNAIGVGYGASGIATKIDEVKSSFKKIAGENTIDKIAGYKDKTTGERAEMYADFDSPDKCKKCNKMGSSVPLPLEYMPQGGDSGGGLFRIKNNEWELIGICSGGGVNLNQLYKTGYYGQVGSWTRVSLYHEWIMQTIK